MALDLFLKQFFSSIFQKCKNAFKKQEPKFLKLILLSFSFFFIIGSYSILRPLKVSVFLGMVGKEYEPITKILSIIILVPCMLLYAKLVDKLRRYQVVYFFLLFYIIGLILFAIGLSHPVLGLKNTDAGISRTLGWSFYLFTELYSPLVVSTFWAFANSISTADYAKKNYGKIVAFSRIGGILTSLVSWYIMEKVLIPYEISIPYLIISCSIFLVTLSAINRLLMMAVPEPLWVRLPKSQTKSTLLMPSVINLLPRSSPIWSSYWIYLSYFFSTYGGQYVNFTGIENCSCFMSKGA